MYLFFYVIYLFNTVILYVFLIAMIWIVVNVYDKTDNVRC